MNITAHNAAAELVQRPFVQKVHDIVKNEDGLTTDQISRRAGYGIALTVTALDCLRDAGRVERVGATWRAMPEPQVYERRVDEECNEYVVLV